MSRQSRNRGNNGGRRPKGIGAIIHVQHGMGKVGSGHRPSGMPSSAAQEVLTQTKFHKILHAAYQKLPARERTVAEKKAAQYALGEMVRGGKEKTLQRMRELAQEMNQYPQNHAKREELHATLQRMVVLYHMGYGKLPGER